MVKKKICLVIPSLQAGGMERVMSELADFLAKRTDTEVSMILYGISREVFYPIPENIVIQIPRFRFNNRLRLIYTIRTLLFLRTAVKKINPEVILSFGEYWNNFVLLSLLGLNVRIFVSDRSQPDKSLGRFHDALRHILYRRATGLIFQTRKAEEIFLSKNKHANVAVIGNPIRIPDSGSNIIKRKKQVLMVGRLIETKHQDRLIKIFAKASPPEWSLKIVGYDHLKQNNMEKLKRISQDLNIGDRVFFTGKLENVEDEYANSSIFAFTSSSEGFPNVIGEAMAAGLPVIAYDCIAGPSEMIIDAHNGFLIPLFDDEQFELKLATLMNDEHLRNKFGANARTSIERFDRIRICDSFYRFMIS